MAKRRTQGDRTKAIGVVRVSTSKQDIGAGAQRDELHRWAADAGVELVAVYEDIGIGGSAPLLRRQGLIDAIAALTEHGAGVLVAVRRDRFARCKYVIADLERAVRDAGAVMVTTDGTCTGDGSETEEVTSSVQDLVAALELRKIRSRNKDRAQRCIREGRLHGGAPRFGWRRRADGVVGRGGRVVELEPDPREQTVISRARALRAEGLSFRAVGARLDAEGHHSRTRKPWLAPQVQRLLARS